jgi:hypothetical protein
VTALDAPVAFFPVARPVFGDFGGETLLGKRVKGGLVVLET